MGRVDVASHVEAIVRNSWGRVGGVRFYSWGGCPEDTTGWLSVTLDATSEGDVDGIGVALEARRISLGLNMAHFDAAVVHLFGHALGFGHGRLGPNKDVVEGGCQSSDVAKEPSGYWERSVMRRHGYCGPADLAPWDVATLQAAYGRKGSGAIVSVGNRCIDIPGELAQQWQVLQIYECNFMRNQTWYRAVEGQLFPGYAPALAIDVAYGAGTPYLQLYARNQPVSSNQQFALTDGQLRGIGDSCLRVSPETNLVQAGPCELLGDQKWSVGSDGRVQVDDRCLTSPGLDGSEADPTLSATACDQTLAQTFDVSRTGQVRQGQRCLEVIDEGDAAGNRPLQLATCRAETDPLLLRQQFYFRGRVATGGQCLHIAGETAFDAAEIEVVDCSPDDPSQWWDYYFTDSI